MQTYLDIVKSRLNPGILIFDPKNKLAYANGAALEYIPGLRRRKVPPEILELCLSIRRRRPSQSPGEEGANYLILSEVSGFPISLRAFPLKEGIAGKVFPFVLILVEKIVDRHLAELDFDGIGKKYGLSKRETQVLELVTQGLSNVVISKRLYISEYTVKDHIKKILSKMKLGSRSGIIASLIQPQGKRP